MVFHLLFSLLFLFIDDSFLSYDDSLSSDSFDTSSDSSSSALSSSPYKLALSSSSFIDSSLSLYAGGGIKSASSTYKVSTYGTTASNIWDFSPIGSVTGDTPSAGTAGSTTNDTSNSETTTTGKVTYSGSRTTGYAISVNTTYYRVYFYGSTTVGATSGYTHSNVSLGGGTYSSGNSAATTGYTFTSSSTAESFAKNLQTAVNASSSNYWYNEYYSSKENFYYIYSYEVTPLTNSSVTTYIPRTTGSTFSSSTTTYSTFQHLKF